MGDIQQDPAVAVLYGPSGAGKTVDMLYSFPTGLFLAMPGALKPAGGVVGFVPDSKEASTIIDATKILEAEGKKGKYPAIIVDDFSLLADRTVSALEAKGKTGFKLWGEMRDIVLDFRDTARRVGMHVLLTAHESTPREVNKVFVRGGPKLPGRLPEDVPTACDLVLRTALDKNRRGWQMCYRCTISDPMWITKDRHGVTPDYSPMNTAEILRQAGFVVPRAPGLEWMEEIIDALAKTMVDEPENEQALVEYAVSVAKEKSDNLLHVRWLLRDALDRATLLRARRNVLDIFTKPPTGGLR